MSTGEEHGIRAEFGQWLRAQLERVGITQTELARQMGVTQPMVSSWVTGDKRPSPANCDRIAEALVLDVDVVLTKAGYRPRLVTDDEPAIREMVELLRHIPERDYPAIQDYLQYQFEKAKRRRRTRPAIG